MRQHFLADGDVRPDPLEQGVARPHPARRFGKREKNSRGLWRKALLTALAADAARGRIEQPVENRQHVGPRLDP